MAEILAEGRITSGHQLGWGIRVENDQHSTGGVFVLFLHPTDESMAFDDWYESLAKFAEAVPTLGYDIAWQGDFARINNCPARPS